MHRSTAPPPVFEERKDSLSRVRSAGPSQSAIAQRPRSSSSPRPYTSFCHTQTAKGFSIGKRARKRQCSGSSASEVEFSKGYRHFTSVITLAQCGITAKVEASLGKRAPPRRHSTPPGRSEPHWGRKPPIGVGRALAAREPREALGQETTYWSRLFTCPNAPFPTPMLARVRPAIARLLRSCTPTRT